MLFSFHTGLNLICAKSHQMSFLLLYIQLCTVDPSCLSVFTHKPDGLSIWPHGWISLYLSWPPFLLFLLMSA